MIAHEKSSTSKEVDIPNTVPTYLIDKDWKLWTFSVKVLSVKILPPQKSPSLILFLFKYVCVFSLQFANKIFIWGTISMNEHIKSSIFGTTCKTRGRRYHRLNNVLSCKVHVSYQRDSIWTNKLWFALNIRWQLSEI